MFSGVAAPIRLDQGEVLPGGYRLVTRVGTRRGPLCLLGFHRWTAWTKPDAAQVETPHPRGPRLREAVVVRRWCRTCSAYQTQVFL